ncbi:hypothetical protein BHM03_00036230 [Ensete ventricosum]|nr:hypothetical protein BHM03_00036230 [Ensete ventricosum]
MTRESLPLFTIATLPLVFSPSSVSALTRRIPQLYDSQPTLSRGFPMGGGDSSEPPQRTPPSHRSRRLEDWRRGEDFEAEYSPERFIYVLRYGWERMGPTNGPLVESSSSSNLIVERRLRTYLDHVEGGEAGVRVAKHGVDGGAGVDAPPPAGISPANPHLLRFPPSPSFHAPDHSKPAVRRRRSCRSEVATEHSAAAHRRCRHRHFGLGDGENGSTTASSLRLYPRNQRYDHRDKQIYINLSTLGQRAESVP